MKTEINDKIFKEQMKEDIKLLQENLSWDTNIKKDEYAFNYWILSNIYNLDKEACNENITEYNDKGIDCFVHYKEDKELYIIQNKYYDDNTNLDSKEVSDFLTRPIANLEDGNYARSPELQKIYNETKQDDAYSVYLHFYITTNNRNKDIDKIMKIAKESNRNAEIFYLNDIKDKYYGKSYKDNISLNMVFSTVNKGVQLSVRPESYNLPDMSEAYYVMTKIIDIYDLWEKANEINYPLFEANIREYLGGTSGINKSIINTLENPQERLKFFYYNNGITIICDKAQASSLKVSISNPEIVNGCQTVNSIAEVLKNNDKKEFENVYVMTKILVLKDSQKEFSKDIVRYTNSQNSINEKVFGATKEPFFKMQEQLEERGLLLSVKQSDKYQFQIKYKEKKKKGILFELANKNSKDDFFNFDTMAKVQIKLEDLIQLIGAFKESAHFAYTKKSFLLRPSSKYYKDFSIEIGNFFTIESMIKLILLYKKAEFDKKNSDDKKSPSPYYLLNFLGFYIDKQGIDKQAFLKKISIDDLIIIYKMFKGFSSEYYEKYKNKHNLEYNQMIKHQVDKEIMNDVIIEQLKAVKSFNDDLYSKITNIFN